MVFCRKRKSQAEAFNKAPVYPGKADGLCHAHGTQDSQASLEVSDMQRLPHCLVRQPQLRLLENGLISCRAMKNCRFRKSKADLSRRLNCRES